MRKISKTGFLALLLAALAGAAHAQTAAPTLDSDQAQSQPTPTPTAPVSVAGGSVYKVYAQVTGLTDGTLLIKNDGDPLLVKADGKIPFKKPVPDGGNYFVETISYSPSLVCAATKASGVVSGADVVVPVSCTRTAGFKLSSSHAQAGQNGTGSGAAPILDQSGNSQTDLSVGAAANSALGTSAAGAAGQSQNQGAAAPALDADNGSGNGDNLTLPSQLTQANNVGASAQRDDKAQQQAKKQGPAQGQPTLTLDSTPPFVFYENEPAKPILFTLSSNVVKVISSPDLPSGLAFHKTGKLSGKISGTPKSVADKTYTLVAYNAQNQKSAPLKVHILIVEKPTMTLAKGEPSWFILTPDIALSKSAKYNKPIYFDLSASVTSIQVTPVDAPTGAPNLPPGLSLKLLKGQNMAEISGTPSGYYPSFKYELVAYNKNKTEQSKTLEIAIAVDGCGDSVVMPDATYDEYVGLANGHISAQDATPNIEGCIKKVQDFDANPPVKGYPPGGRVVFRHGAYDLKSILDLTPNGIKIDSFTFKTEGVGLGEARYCKPPWSVSYSGERVQEYGNSADGPDCAILLADHDLTKNHIPFYKYFKWIGGFIVSDYDVTHSRFDHLIVDGNHSNRKSNGNYVSGCNQNGFRGFNTQINSNNTIYSYVQFLHAVCGSGFIAGDVGVTYDHVFSGHHGSMSPLLYSDSGFGGGYSNGLTVKYCTEEDVTDVQMIFGSFNSKKAGEAPPGSPETMPAVIEYNNFIQGYGKDGNTATSGLWAFIWPGENGNFENTITKQKTIVAHNCVEDHGRINPENNPSPGYGFGLSEKGFNGDAEDNAVSCANGIDAASRWTNSGNSYESACGNCPTHWGN